MKVSVVALGISNLGSLVEALRRVGASPEVIGTPREILSSPRLVLPGVGAFGEGMASILRLGLRLPLQDYAASGRPLLGICLGMQLLFDASHEQGNHEGLGILRGEVKKLVSPGPEFWLPHMGWSDVESTEKGRLLLGKDPAPYYFLHSYVAEVRNQDEVAGTFAFGAPRTAAVARESVFGVQFHPEKSSDPGLDLLQRFTALT